jgi:hypothetical protein
MLLWQEISKTDLLLLQMPMSQVQQMYGQGVMPAQIATPQMFVQPQLSVVRYFSHIA